MAVFNSLGSNYSWRFSLRYLFSAGSRRWNQELSTALGQHYGGQATLTYKGREALELALKRSSLPAGSHVGINGFTCYVVYAAVKNAGLEPVFVDVSPGALDFSLQTLKNASQLNAVIIQNTLGYPIDMAAMEAYCQQQRIMIIEDLAHSLGAVYADGREAGSVGAATMLSFSQDKPLDVVAGGALIERQTSTDHASLGTVSLIQQLKNRWYPFWTGLIRTTYPVGLGRILHYGLKHLNLLATPMNDDLSGLHQMSGATAKQALRRWQERAAELTHRRTIAAIYQQALPASVQFVKANGQPTYLRFPIWVDNRAALVQFLKTHQIYIGDTWYDAPIGPARYLAKTNYATGQCPEAEKLAAHIVNLPTHQHVSERQARFIAAKVTEWVGSHG